MTQEITRRVTMIIMGQFDGSGAAVTTAPSFVLSCSAVTSFVWSMLPQTIRGMPSHTITRGTRRTSENVNPGLVLSNKIPALAMAPPFNTSSNALSKKCPCIVLRHFLLI